MSELSSSDLILASYPRSGNTWVRFMLVNLALKLSGEENQIVNAFNISFFSPELPGRLGPDRFKGRMPRVVKTHLKYDKLFSKVLYVVRRPEDVMRSYYVYAKARGLVGSQTTPMEFLKHPRYGVTAWKQHTESYLNAASRSFTVQIFRYETIKEDPKATLQRIARLLGVSACEDLINRVMSQTKMETLKAEEQFLSASGACLSKEFKFFGGTDHHEVSFNDEQLKFISDNTKGITSALVSSQK